MHRFVSRFCRPQVDFDDRRPKVWHRLACNTEYIGLQSFGQNQQNRYDSPDAMVRIFDPLGVSVSLRHNCKTAELQN